MKRFNPFEIYQAAKKPKLSKISKISKKSEEVVNEDSDSEEEKELPFPFNITQKMGDKIYLTENHLYFNTDVSKSSVDNVKKLMREYAQDYKKINKNVMIEIIKPKPLYLHINSPGGCVHSGFSLYDFIREYNKFIPVHTIVEGLAASSATIISCAGEYRYITPNSFMLIHQLSTFMGGNFQQLKDEFGNCQKVMDKIIDIYTKHANINKKKLPDILKHDIIWDAEECIKQGLVNEIKLLDIFN